MAEVRPFLESVLRGVRIPQARFDEVVHHYEVIGGVSPYNAITEAQKAALERELAARGLDVPVVVGYRHSEPSFADALRDLRSRGVREAVGFVLASLRSHASFEKYIERLEEAGKETGIEIAFSYTGPFHEHPLFIEAQADEASKVLDAIGRGRLDEIRVIFSAHSIPVPMADQSGYHRQFERMSSLIAEKLGVRHWSTAYQSRSGNPRDPWLEPSVESVIEGVDAKRFKHVLAISPGFLCDNVEVIYDLDHECRLLCEKLGLVYHRARTVTDHPKFIRLVADLVREKL